jgi:hypothetical protein
MLLLSRLLRAYLLRQWLTGGRRQRRSRGRGGLFPFPHYSTRTRGGSRVTIGGCCLPLALTLGVGISATLAAVVRLLAAATRL